MSRSRRAGAGRLLVIFGFGEETQAHHDARGARDASGTIDAAMVGEPTNLELAVAQRGLMMVDLLAQGDQRHAGYAAGASFTNAAIVLARDLLKLETLCQDRAHPVLGRATVTPTMVEAGVSRNVTPPVAKAVLDIRSTPSWSHEEIGEVMSAALESEVVVTSTRLVPCETPARFPAARSAPAGPSRGDDLRQSDLLRLGVPATTATPSSAGRAPAGGRTRRTSTSTWRR